MTTLLLTRCLLVLLAAASYVTSDFSLSGDPCSNHDFCHSKSATRQCSCQPDCQLYGTCCQDVETTGDARPEFRCYGGRGGRVARPVWARRACRDEFRGHEADRLACLDDDEDEMDVAGNILVSSKKTGVVYWNRHCAKCSLEREEDVEKWNTEVRCPRLPGVKAGLIRKNLTFSPDTKEWGLLMMNTENNETTFHPCSVHYAPPDDKVRYCKPDIISTCPDNYTVQGVVTKCSLYYAERRLKNTDTVYKNIHCAICNIANIPDLGCEGMAEDPEVEDDGSDDRVVVTFWSGDWLEKEPGKRFECSKGYAYDPARKKCRSYVFKEEPRVATSRSSAVVSAAAVVLISALFLIL